MNTELEPGFYYWKLTAEKPSTGSKRIKLVMIPAILGKMQGLKYAMIDFQRQVGQAWKVTHQALSENCYLKRVSAIKKEESIWKERLR